MNRFETMVSQFKTYIITEELIKYDGNISKTAAAFGIHRNSLSRNIIEHNIDLEEIKAKVKERKNAQAHSIPVATGSVSVIDGGRAGSEPAAGESDGGIPDDEEGESRVLAQVGEG